MKRKISYFLACSILVVTLASCGGKESSNVAPTSSTNPTSTPAPTSITPKYQVRFENASVSAVTLEAGSSLSEPAKPADKNNSMFEAWYTDAKLTTKASFPMVINQNTTLYAKYVTYKEMFLKLRENLVKENSKGFEYDYTFSVTAKLSTPQLTVQGLQEGNTKYNPASDVSYRDSHTNSGLLFNDGTVHEYVNKQTVNKVVLNEKDEVTSFDTSSTTEKVKYDTSSFAKAIFSYTDADIKEVNKVNGVSNAYQLKTKAGVSSIASILLNHVNHPIVSKVIKVSLPNTTADTSCIAKYDNQNLTSFEYNMTVNVSAITLTIKYVMTFKSIDTAVAISAPTFDNFITDTAGIQTALAKINTAITNYKELEDSSNTFKLKTGVDFGLTTSSIDATIQGKSHRHNDAGVTYYANRIEIDTDHKNNDLYAAQELKDVEYIRGKIADGTVYDKRKKTVLGWDAPIVTTEDAQDDFYLLLDNSVINASNVNSISTSNKDYETYGLTLTKEGRLALMNYLNTVKLNPFVTTDATLLGNFDGTSISSKDVKIEVNLSKSDASLVSITIKMKGDFETKFNNSRDFTTKDSANFDIEYEFKVTNQGVYTVPASSSDLDL